MIKFKIILLPIIFLFELVQNLSITINANSGCNENIYFSKVIPNQLRCFQLSRCTGCRLMIFNSSIDSCILDNCPEHYISNYTSQLSNFKGILLNILKIVAPNKKYHFCLVIIRDGLIRSENVTNLGDWYPFEFCPLGSYAIGFLVRVMEYSGWWDDTMMNAVKLICNDATNTLISSNEGYEGTWSENLFCPNATGLNGFIFKAEPLNTTASYDPVMETFDNTAANGINMFCQGDFNALVPTIEGIYGNWSKPIFCDYDKKICGISVQFHDFQGKGVYLDDTALNNVKFKCC